MPRLLPRLLRWIEQNPLSDPKYSGPLFKSKKRRRPSSLWRPTVPIDETSASLSPIGRKRSILLDEQNMLITPAAYEMHKTLPPTVNGKENATQATQDVPREMTEEEKQWWSSPYLRMLSSPIRQCILSKRLLPSDFLIRLVILKTPMRHMKKSTSILVPDGILHPKFANRLFGHGHHIACWKEAVEEMSKQQIHRRLIPSLHAHSLLVEHISHQLRLRVLQELEMLVIRLGFASKNMDGHTVVRRLTRSEWVKLKEDGRIPWKDAAFIMVVPAVNRDPVTKERPKPEMLGTPPQDETPSPKESLPPLPPLSTLLSTSSRLSEEACNFPQIEQPVSHQVPLYNGLSLFPHRPHRAAAHKYLSQLASLERKMQRRSGIFNEENNTETRTFAYLFYSSADTIRRVDTVPLAVALWRVRMWEGTGWGKSDWVLDNDS